jgi:hypothetical protein
MPSVFGVIKRACIYNDTSGTNKKLILYVTSQSPNGFLRKAQQVTKNNLKTWINKNKMISDMIDIKDAYIINIGFDYEFTMDNREERTVVLRRVNEEVKALFSEKLHIGEPISISEIYNKINKTRGVIDTIKVIPRILTSSGYSDAGGLEIDDLISADGTRITCPKNCILEVKYIHSDIKGFII